MAQREKKINIELGLKTVSRGVAKKSKFGNWFKPVHPSKKPFSQQLLASSEHGAASRSIHSLISFEVP